MTFEEKSGALKARRLEIQSEIENLRSAKVAEARLLRIACVHCKAISELGDWWFVQDHWYTSPHGCSGGDFWTPSEKEVCHMACPHCGVMNYLYTHPAKAEILLRIKDPDCPLMEIFTRIYTQHGRHQQRGPKLVFTRPEPVTT